MSEIWAVLEHAEATLHAASGELVSELMDIARRQLTRATVCAVLLLAPETQSPDITLLSQFGIEHLYFLEHAQLARYSTLSYVGALAWFIQQRTPLLVATSATPNGRDWTPRLAAELHLPFVPNCLSLDLHDQSLLALRSIYEGRAYVQTRTALRGRTALATLVPGVRGVPAHKHLSPIPPLEITRFTPEISQDHKQERVRHVAVQAPSPEEVELDAAERIVAGGRGVGQVGFNTIASFAHLLGAAVGAGRVATDLGWIEHARQFG